MSKETYLIIIGAGPGGYRAAEYAAKQGLKVTIYEEGEVFYPGPHFSWVAAYANQEMRDWLFEHSK